MERCLVVVLAAALLASAGAVRYADYAAAQMPQYEAINYDHARNPPPDESYRDHDPPADVTVSIDYNDYGRSNNERRTLVNLHEVDSLPALNNPRKKSTSDEMDYGESDYNYKSEKISPRMRISRKSSNNRNKSKIKQIGAVTPISKPGRSANDNQLSDDEELERSSKLYEEEDEFSSDHDRNRFVRREIRQKDRQQKTTGARLSDPEYDAQDDGGHIKDPSKMGPDYSEPEPPRYRPNAVLPLSRPQNYNPAADDVDESPSLVTNKYRAPMPKYRKKATEYVDYTDMSRIEKIKNLSARRSTVRSGASQSQRWSYKDSFRRRNFNEPLQQTVQVTPSINASAATNKTTLPIQIADLPPEIIKNITAFINKSRHLSLAEKSQLSILKKAQRKDTAKDEMLKDKPPVLLQVTERLQTVVMVEPPVSQEPWLRARDISEDSPDRIEKVKRFMRNKLVATARNVSELMENWDDTICDYVDISMLDKNAAVCIYTFSSLTNSTGNGTAVNQLQAALGQKDPVPAITVLTTPITIEPLPTFKPDSVDPSLDVQWNQFLISTNHTARQHFSMCVYLFTVILLLLNI